MAELRHRLLVGHGSYQDVYSDQYVDDNLYIVFRKQYNSWAPDDRLSSVFEGDAELEEFPDIWGAISAVWSTRGDYDLPGMKIALDAALSAAGYTAPGGVPL